MTAGTILTYAGVRQSTPLASETIVQGGVNVEIQRVCFINIANTISVNSGLTATALANGSYRPILAIRADNVISGGAVANTGTIFPLWTVVINPGAAPIAVQVVLNPSTLTQAGGAITWANAGAISESAAFTNAADTIAGGTLVDTFYVPSLGYANGKGTRALVYASSGDVLAISAAGLGGTSSAYAAFVWSESY